MLGRNNFCGSDLPLSIYNISPADEQAFASLDLRTRQSVCDAAAKIPAGGSFMPDSACETDLF